MTNTTEREDRLKMPPPPPLTASEMDSRNRRRIRTEIFLLEQEQDRLLATDEELEDALRDFRDEMRAEEMMSALDDEPYSQRYYDLARHVDEIRLAQDALEERRRQLDDDIQALMDEEEELFSEDDE